MERMGTEEEVRGIVRRALEAEGPTSYAGATIPDTVGEEEANALGDVIDIYRLAMGWQPLDDDDHDAMLKSWFVVLDAAGVPARHYLACYRRAVDSKARRLAEGSDELRTISALDLAAEWAAVRAELERALVESRRFIAKKARPDCPTCFGTGREQIRVNELGEADPDGKRYAVKGPCECREVQV